jgi:type 1 glutamine amidotransferase
MNMSKKALIVWGGWDGHEPKQVGEIFANILKEEEFEVEISDTLDSFNDKQRLMELNLIIPIWTMGEIKGEYVANISEAVASGVGMVGCHGGMCDAFRNDTEWQFITGSQWVSHPGGGVEYRVNICKSASSPIIEGLNDFNVYSEQYYIHVDPAVNVLATTTFPVFDGPHAANGDVKVPVVYTKRWGKGKIFYSTLGHVANVFDIYEAKELMHRGFIWAAK